MIRPFGLRDISTIRRLQPRGVAFDLRRLLLYSTSPTRSALLGYLSRNHLGTITCVHENSSSAESGQRGCAQVWPRPGRAEWDLVFLAPSLDHHQKASEIWRQLLAHLIIQGAKQDIQRIYARSSEDAEAEDILRQVGFTIVAREEVFVLSHRPAPAPLPKGLRRVDRRQDRWALSELCRQVVPPLVQQAEGLLPHRCAAPHHPLARFLFADEYVWVEKGKIIAYLGLCGSARGYWLEITVRPEYRADLLPYIKYVLTLAQRLNSTPVYCSIPDYSVGLGWLLRTLGFESYTRQVLLVVHTVARVPVRRRLVIPGLERGVDTDPLGRVGAPLEQRAQN